MSRTREIEVYVQSKILTDEDSTVRSVRPMYNPFDGEDVNLSSGWVKAKLMIELPERKVTISESDLMDSITKYCHQNPSVKSLNEMMKMFRDDLFKDA